MEKPSIGETVTVEVNRISRSGNGIIEFKNGHINVGPISQESVGKQIQIVRVGGKFGRCKNDGSWIAVPCRDDFVAVS